MPTSVGNLRAMRADITAMPRSTLSASARVSEALSETATVVTSPVNSSATTSASATESASAITAEDLKLLFAEHSLVMPWAMEHAALGRRLRDKLGRRADGTDALQSPGTSDPPPVRATPLDTVVDDASLQHMAKPIQNGFSPQFMLAHSSPTLQTALYIPRHSDQFITVDTNNVYVWIGDKRVKKLRIPSAAVDEKSGGDSAVNVQGHGRANISERRTTVGSTEQTVPALSSATRYCVINKYRLLVVATSRLELVLIDTADFQHQSSVSTAKPVIALSFIEELDMIVAAGVGGVSLWSISKAELSGKRSYQIDAAPKFDFNADFDTDEWVRATCYDHTKQRLYVACEQDFWAYSLDSGKRLGGVREAHRLSLTCIQVHTRTQFVVTGARDFEIKLWNSLLQHVVTFRDHHGPITGLIFLEGDCDAARVQPLSQLEREQRRDPSQDDEDTIVDTFRLRHDHQRLPYLVSTSEDATIRLWHLDSARWIYKQRHDKPIFGMQHMRGETFMFFTKEKTHVWTLDRCFTPFTDVQSHVERMSRVRLDSRTVPVAMQHGLDVERLVVVAEDGSIRLVSPVTAQTITIAFPFYRDVPINEVLYDWRSERLYVWLADGDILTYDCALNPCRIVHQWGSSQNSLAENPSRSNRNTRGNIQCLVGLWMDDAYCMMAGMDTGEVCTVNMERSGKKDVICLAHASPITAMYVCESKRELFTAGTDGVIKVWSVSMRSEMQERETVSTGHLLSATSKLTLTQMGSIPYNTTIYMNPRALSYDKDNERVHAVFQVVYSEVNDTKKPGKNDSIVESIGEQLVIFNRITQKSLQSTMNDDYHTKPITQTAHLPPLNIALSVSLDGSARVWDGETNMLIRELNFGEPLTSATFINNRGDFVLGMRDSVFLVKGKDYLPLSKQARLYARQDVRDQAIEEPLMFDPILSIWALMKHEEMNEVVQTQPVDEPKETPASPVKSILCSDGLRQRMLTYMQNRLIAAHARNERRAFDLARMYEPIMRFSHLANSGVDWAYFLPHYKAFCPDAVIDAAMPAEVLYREKAQLFNNAVRLESAKDVLQFIGDHFLQELRSQDQWTAQERELAIMDSEMTTIMQDIDNVAAPTLEDEMSFLEDTDFAQIYSNRKALAVAHQHVQEPTVQVPQEQLEPQIKVNDEAAAKALRQQNEKLAEQARIAAIELEKRIKRKNALRKHIAANSPAVPNSFKVARKVAEQPTKPIVKKPERNAALAAEKEKERLERKKALEEGARERRRNQIALEEAQAAERAAAERAAAAAVDVNAPATVEAQSPAAPAPTLVTAPAPNVQPAAELVLATPITSFTAPAVVQVTPAVASVIPNQIPIASMNIASSAIPATARIVPLADLEYLLKTKWFPQKQNQPLNTVDEYAQVLLQMLRTSIADIFKMEASKALSRICARNSGELKDTTLAQIIEAMTEACSNGSAIVRAQVSTDLAVFNNLVVHENGGAGWTISPNADANIAELTVQIAAALAPVRPIITALLQRMGDSQREVYTAAVQSLAAYGIVTKNQLRAAMISCELLEASAPPLADASTVAATLLVAVGSVPSVTSGSVSSAADGSVSSVADGSVPSVALGSVSRVPVGSAPSAAVGSVRSIVTVRSVPSAAIASVPPVKSPLPGRSALPVAPAAPVAATDDSPVGIASQPKPTVRKNKMPTTVDPTPEPKLQTKPTKSQSAPVRRPVEFQLETLKAKSGNAIDEEMEDPRKLARPKTTPSKQQGKVMFRLAGGRMFPNYL